MTDKYPQREETLTTGQPAITGYRNLTPDEIDLMNRIKAFGAACEEILTAVHAHLGAQVVNALNATDSAETARIDAAQPHRWTAMARTDFQTALMKLTRAVAQPTSF